MGHEIEDNVHHYCLPVTITGVSCLFASVVVKSYYLGAAVGSGSDKVKSYRQLSR